MERAIELAKEGVNNDGGPFGAVVVKDGKIIAEAYNEVTLTNDPTAHAEVLAIKRACKALNTFDLSGCEIYSSCEPCPMCLGAIYWAKIGKLYYSANRDDAKKAGFKDSIIYSEVMLRNEDRQLCTVRMEVKGDEEPFDLWMKKQDKICY
jgi:tRNA(Arg) A34 adenosine deaminase TadA